MFSSRGINRLILVHKIGVVVTILLAILSVLSYLEIIPKVHIGVYFISFTLLIMSLLLLAVVVILRKVIEN